MKDLEQVALDKECNKVWLQTAWSMSEAISLYEGLGYQQEGYQPRQFYGEDFIMFGKVLSSPVRPNKNTSTLNGAIILFPGVEELDFVGVYEVLTKTAVMSEEGNVILEKPPRISLVARRQRITCANGMVVHPHERIQGFSAFDFIVLPGGRGVEKLLNDRELLNTIRAFETQGKVISSVCTGALVLAWAGILEGRKATTHHLHRDKLAQYCEVLAERVVTDGNVVTAAGISASLDLGVQLVNRFYSPEVAKQVALRIEYPIKFIGESWLAFA
jgi:transcriptional regulator GlxA family with amidase domain